MQSNKRFHSVTTRAPNLQSSQLTRVNYYNSKPKSVETIRTGNKLLKSFVKGGGFGFNYYLNDNSEKDTQDSSNKINNSNSNNSHHTLNSNHTAFPGNAVLMKDESFGRENLKDEEINTEIDKLLNYYMSQMNESSFQLMIEVDKSYDELDDSESEESLNDDDIQNMMKPLDKPELHKLPSIVTKLEKEEISGIKPTSSLSIII